MRKIVKRVFAAMLAATLSFSGISFPAKAAEADMENGFEVDNYDTAETLEEFQDAVLELHEETSLESDGKYESKRLIVFSETLDFYSYGAESAVSYEDMHVLSYKTEKECEEAYNQLADDESVLSVEVDEIMETEEGISSVSDSDYEMKESEIKKIIDKSEPQKDITVAVLDTGIDSSCIDDDCFIDTGGEPF